MTARHRLSEEEGLIYSLHFFFIPHLIIFHASFFNGKDGNNNNSSCCCLVVLDNKTSVKSFEILNQVYIQRMDFSFEMQKGKEFNSTDFIVRQPCLSSCRDQRDTRPHDSLISKEFCD